MEPKAAYLSRPWLPHYEPGVAPAIDVPACSVADLFDSACQRFSQRTALIFYGRKISFAELHEATNRLASSLARLGLKKGDRIALYLVNSPQFAIAYFAALKLGCVLTPISPVYTSHEVRYQLQDSGARALVCQDVLYDKVAKTGLAIEHLIITDISEYLPSVKKWLAKPFVAKLIGGNATAAGAPAAAGVLRFQDLLAKGTPNFSNTPIDAQRCV